MTRLRILVAATTLAIAVTFLMALPAPRSEARATSCSGNLIFTQPLKDGKKRKVGELNVFWNPATKKNCAVTMHAGPTWGKKLKTLIRLTTCIKGTRAGDPCYQDGRREQQGRYAFRAGPVSLKAAGRCIHARAEIHMPSGFIAVRETRRNVVAAFCK